MNREIKFRALKNKKWWYSDDEAYCLKEYDGVLYLCEDENYYSNAETWLVKIGKAIQYTGLKDKNGVEIYEGDISYIGGLGNCECTFTHCTWGWENKTHLDFFDECEEMNNIIIIGNIHQNPELLK